MAGYSGFAGLVKKLSGRPGVKNPGGLAASIGDKKYGKAKMGQASAFGRSNPDAKPMLAPRPPFGGGGFSGGQ